MKKIITYDENGMIEGNLAELPKKLRGKAIRQRGLWILKNPMTWLMIGMLIFVMIYITTYLAPTLEKQSKQMTCLNNGYYDYQSSTNTCYELYGKSDDFKCVESGKCKGSN